MSCRLGEFPESVQAKYQGLDRLVISARRAKHWSMAEGVAGVAVQSRDFLFGRISKM